MYVLRGGLKRENRQIGMFLKKIKKAHFREFSAFAPKSMKSANFLVVDSKYSSFLYVHFQRNLCSPRLLKMRLCAIEPKFLFCHKCATLIFDQNTHFDNIFCSFIQK